MPHEWLTIALGRVCSKCSVVQADGEFDDDDKCARDKLYISARRAPAASGGGGDGSASRDSGSGGDGAEPVEDSDEEVASDAKS